MKIFLLAIFASCFFCDSVFSQNNIQVSSGVLFDGEPYLAVNPTNPDNMVIAWMSYVPNSNVPLLEQIGIRTKASFDGGRTWSNENRLPHIRPQFHSADVSMAFHGNILYICYIDYHERPDSGVIVVCHSSDGGRSWSDPVKAFDLYDNNDKPIDRPWMVIDNSTLSSNGTIYITTKPAPFDTMPNRPYMKYSTDGGNSWSRIDTVDGGDYPSTLIEAPMASPTVTASGIFCAAYVSWNLKKSLYPRACFASSSDNGLTYNRTTIAILKSGSGKDTLSKLGFHLAADPKNANNLITVWVDARDGDNDIYSSETTDGGQTWSEALRINDDQKNNGVWQDLVWADYSDNGKCVVSWRDRRNGDSTGYEKGSDIYFATSIDNGKSFGKNIRLSDQTASHTISLDHPGNDFHCCAIVHDSVCATWGDTRNGRLSIYFAKASLSDGIANVIEVNDNKNIFRIYPNPAKNSIRVEFSDDKKNHELWIYDESGKEIMHQLSGGWIDISKLSTGNYSISAKVKNIIISQKFIIER
jgi:hypothetical protein